MADILADLEPGGDATSENKTSQRVVV